MNDPETEFERELLVFRNEVHEATQSFYAEQTVHNVARSDAQVFQALNRHAAFWNLTTRALQMNALIVLGRIFDEDRHSHGVRRLLCLAKTNSHIFSKVALERRKRPQAGTWTEEYMRDVYVPNSRDFVRLQRHTDRQRTIYRSKYKALRDKFVAHRDRADVAALFVNARIPELEKLLRFLNVLHDALWELFANGRKPIFRPTRYSARQILKLAPNSRHSAAESEWITYETKKFLEYLREAAKHRIR
jgi:hypothetical protein